MNAPEAVPTVVMLPIGQIVKSPTNPRKHFNEAALSELADSIKNQGMIQPITVRQWEVGMFLPPKKVFGDMAGMHEIVAGERRWRAATLAGLSEIPAIVRKLTDVQVLEIQVIENLQREDVHPLEEAEGYERLMKEAGYNADTLGDKVGKSRGYIYARLKLLDLCPEARDAFYESQLDASTALLVARIPGKVLQKKAVKELTQGYGGAPMSYRSAKEHVRRNFMLRLAEATFKPGDTNLIPTAGSCKDCPKRTGNNPDLFGDVDDVDVCTDPKCFDDKRQAHYLKLKENAEKKGIKIIEGADARKVMPYHISSLGGGLVALDAPCYDDPEHRTYRQILGKDAPVSAIVETNSTYESKRPLVEVAEQKVLAEALKKAGVVSATAKGAEETKKREAERAAEAAALEVEKAWRAHLFQAVREKFGARFAASKTLAPEELTLLSTNLFRVLAYGDDVLAEQISALWGHPLDTDKDLDDAIKGFTDHLITLDAAATCLFLTDMAFIDQAEVKPWQLREGEKPERLLAEAKRLGIDTDALRKPFEKAKAPAEKPEPRAKKTAKPASTPSHAAQAPEESAAKPAAPAKAKGVGKKPASKKPEEKTDPAPASPANEPPAAANPSTLDPATAWPFPKVARV